jgi:ankyrin repeat protein
MTTATSTASTTSTNSPTNSNKNGAMNEWAPLHVAVTSGTESECQTLVDQLGANGTLSRVINSIVGTEGLTPALIAASNGNIPVLKLLISSGADIHATTNHACNMLHLCASNGRIDACSYLIKLYKIADILPAMLESKNCDGLTPALSAASQGQFATLKTLIDAGADIAVMDNEHWTLLHWCAMKDDESMCISLIEQYRTSGVLSQMLENKTTEGDTAALVAASNNRLAILKLLASAGSDMRATHVGGISMLHWCAEKGYEDTCAWLIELYRASEDYVTVLESRTSEGDTAAMLAVWSGHLPVVKVLAFAGADMGATDEKAWSMVHWCAIRGHEEVCSWLVDQYKQADAITQVLEARTVEGYTAALVAASNGQLSVLKLLACAGADMSVTDNNGLSILHWCAAEGYEAVCTWIIESFQGTPELFALLDRKNKEGHTAAWVAASECQLKTFEILADAGADMYVVDSDQLSMFHWAAKKGYEEVCLWLIDWFRDTAELSEMLESRTSEGLSVALVSASEDKLAVLKLLAKAGANLHAVDKNGFSVLHWAAMKGYETMCSWILEYALNSSGMRQIKKTSEEDAASLLQALKAVATSGIEVTTENSKVLQTWCAANGFDGMCSKLIELYQVSSGLSHMMEMRTNDGNSASLVAASCGHVGILRLLADSGADMQAADSNGYTCMHWCAMKGHEEAFMWLMDLYRGSNSLPTMLEQRTAVRDTVALCAASNGQLTLLQLLAAAGADMHAAGKGGLSMLHWCGMKGYEDMCSWLIEYYQGTNDILRMMEMRTHNGSTAALIAASAGQLVVLQLLAAAGAVMHATNKKGWNMLHWCAAKGYEEVCTWLIEMYRRANEVLHMLESQTNEGFTAALLAASENQLVVLKLLASVGADMHATDKNGLSMLHLCAMKGNEEMCIWLIDWYRGSSELPKNLEVRTHIGSTPALTAAHNDRLAIVKLLAQAGADLTAVDRSNRSMLHWCAEKGYQDMCSWLIDYYRSRSNDELTQMLEKRTQDGGVTAALMAASNSQLPVLKLLSDAGADLHAGDNHGRTALQVGAEKGYSITDICMSVEAQAATELFLSLGITNE